MLLLEGAAPWVWNPTISLKVSRWAPEWFVILVLVPPQELSTTRQLQHASPGCGQLKMWLHSTLLVTSFFFCSVVVFLFYCIYLISSRSVGPKHTCIREMIFHWNLLAPLLWDRLLKHSTVGGNLALPMPHCCPVPSPVTARGRRRHTLGLFRSSHQRIQHRLIVYSTAQYSTSNPPRRH